MYLVRFLVLTFPLPSKIKTNLNPKKRNWITYKIINSVKANKKVLVVSKMHYKTNNRQNSEVLLTKIKNFPSKLKNKKNCILTHRKQSAAGPQFPSFLNR